MRLISGQLTLDATDKDILTIPKRSVALARRLRIRNDTGAARTITFQDRFTPDPSAGVSSPGAQTIDRYGKVIANATEWELDGTVEPIFKILNNFRVASDVTGCILAYTLELS